MFFDIDLLRPAIEEETYIEIPEKWILGRVALEERFIKSEISSARVKDVGPDQRGSVLGILSWSPAEREEPSKNPVHQKTCPKLISTKTKAKKSNDCKLITLSHVPRSSIKLVAREETHKPSDIHQAPPLWIRNREAEVPSKLWTLDGGAASKNWHCSKHGQKCTRRSECHQLEDYKAG